MSLQEAQVLLGVVFGAVGMVTGTVGLVVSVFAYRRDRPKVQVRVSWGMRPTHGGRYDPDKLYGTVTVANVGRRPVFVSHAQLALPLGMTRERILLAEAVAGQEIPEGGRPVMWLVEQESLKNYPDYVVNWKKVRAVVVDSAGQEWRSKPLRRTGKPSWVE